MIKISETLFLNPTLIQSIEFSRDGQTPVARVHMLGGPQRRDPGDGANLPQVKPQAAYVFRGEEASALYRYAEQAQTWPLPSSTESST